MTRSSENVQRSKYNYRIRPLDTEPKTNPTSGRRKEILPTTTTSRRRTERERTEDDETEQRRDERVLLDRVVDRLGGLSGRPAGRPVSDAPKTPWIGPEAALARNHEIVNTVSIENPTKDDGR